MMDRASAWRRLRRIFQRDPGSELDDELRFHLDQRMRDYRERGMDPDAAKKAALERLGDAERVRNECARLLAAERRARKRRIRVSVSWLDVKLGVRMLAKYPGLSAVSVIGMAVAIAIGVTAFGLIDEMLHPSIPLPRGDRIVTLQNNRADNPGNPQRQVLHDFVMWRDALRSVSDLGAYRDESRNLIIADGSVELVRLAEMTATGFRVARVAPLLGRPLVQDDERAGAAPVLVVGYDEWYRRFNGDPEIIGRTVRLGETVHTIVGVMPAAFRFPVNHGYWTPLRLNPLNYERGSGPALEVFGRLVDGVTLEQARAELAAIGRRMSAEFPDTHEHLRPQVIPYGHSVFDIDSPGIAWVLYAAQVAISLLLVVVAVNVAALVYARTATRTGEIAVRTALGASRARVIAQLFVEAVVLSATAAAVGMAIAGGTLGFVERFLELAGFLLPFWFDLGVDAEVIAYVAVLAIVGGAIVGVLPALRATGRHVHAGLQQLASRSSQMQLGRTWTTLIVAQVAVAVAAMPAAIFYADSMARSGVGDPGYPIDEFVSAWLPLEREDAPSAVEAAEYERAFPIRLEALLRRLQLEPGVRSAIATYFPGSGRSALIELEGAGTVTDATTGSERRERTQHRISANGIGGGLFDLFDLPVLAGRDFTDADARSASRSVIVNQTFAARVGGGGGVLGRRIRYITDPRAASSDTEGERNPWFEIVGVVQDFAAPTGIDSDDAERPTVYHPVTAAGGGVPGEYALPWITMIVRVNGGPTPGFIERLRDLSAAVHPSLQLHDLERVAESRRATRRAWRAVALGIAVATLSVLLLSAAGIYAMLSFTVAKRRREIGIRTALGADPRRILSGIFARASAQLGTGVAIGMILAVILEWATDGMVLGGQATYGQVHAAFVLLPLVAAIMMIVGMLAALGPARRGLAIQPTEALREE